MLLLLNQKKICIQTLLFDQKRGLFYFLAFLNDVCHFCIKSFFGCVCAFSLKRKHKRLSMRLHYIDDIETIILHTWLYKRSSFDMKQPQDFTIKLSNLNHIVVEKSNNKTVESLMSKYAQNEQRKCLECAVLRYYEIEYNCKTDYPLRFQLEPKFCIFLYQRFTFSIPSNYQLLVTNRPKIPFITSITLVRITKKVVLFKICLLSGTKWYRSIVDHTKKVITFYHLPHLDDVGWIVKCPIEKTLSYVNHLYEFNVHKVDKHVI